MSTDNSFIEIKNLHASIGDREILKGVDLAMNLGETHALMGPNGSGKSTLAHVIMGNPVYEVTQGEILVRGENILELEIEERALLGLFLAFQYPVALPGVSVAKFIKSAVDVRAGESRQKAAGFLKALRENLKFLGLDETFVNRNLNEGFSGGEKKRIEILQMLMLKPHFAVMDETDSGLDIDALRIVSEGVQKLAGPEFGMLVITHYERILRYLKPSHMHVLIDGRIALSGGPELVQEVESKGYDWIREKFGSEVLV